MNMALLRRYHPYKTVIADQKPEVIDFKEKLHGVFECVKCAQVRSHMYDLECAHNMCLKCLTDTPRVCTCGHEIRKMPSPYTSEKRHVLFHVFEKDPMSEIAYRESMMNEMQEKSSVIKVKMYGPKLYAEMEAVRDVARLVRCNCNLISVRTQSVKDSKKFFYGCPKWSGRGSGCGFYMPVLPCHGNIHADGSSGAKEITISNPPGSPKPTGGLDFL